MSVLGSLASVAIFTPLPVSASSPDLVWFDFEGMPSNNYVDNQERAHAVRLRAGSLEDMRVAKWCIAIDGQPFKMSGSWGEMSGYEETYTNFRYGNFAYGSFGDQTEPGCWAITQPQNQSYFFDTTIPVFSLSEGIHSITITSHHLGGTTTAKTIVFKRVAPRVVTTLFEVAPKIDGAVIAGSKVIRVVDSSMPYNSISMGHEKFCLSISPQPPKNIIDDAKPQFDVHDNKFSQVATRQGDCWLGENIPPNSQGLFYGARWRGVSFSLDTLRWPDATYTLVIDAHRWDTLISRLTTTFRTTNPALDVSVSGVTENENVGGLRTISVGAVIGSVHTSQITPSKYCVDVDGQVCTLTTSTSNPSATFKFVSQLYPDGGHSLKIRAIDSAGREASKTVVLQIVNGKPTVSGVKVSTTKPAGANGLASALISFSAPRTSAATVEIRSGKAKVVSVDVDLTSSTDGLSSVNFENLQPSTKFTYRVSSRNANGESKTVTGKFTTPAAPKPVSGGGGSGSGSSSGSGYGTSVIGWPLDKALAALGWSRLQAAEASGCRNKTWFGIVNLDNWIVVGQTSSMLYACKP